MPLMPDAASRYTLLTDGHAVRLARGPTGHTVLLVATEADAVSADALPLDAGYPVLLALLDLIELEGSPWLVYEWADDAAALSTRLEDGPMPVLDALSIVLRVLDGVCHAQLIGLSVSGLTPERILLGEEAKDTRIAAVLPQDPAQNQSLVQSGNLLYEMLTGIPPVRSPEGELLPPAQINPDISAHLEYLITSALGESGGRPYGGMLEFRIALADHLAELETLLGIGEDLGPAGRLLRRMGETDEFPALSRVIGAISRINDSDAERLQSLSAVVLRDVSLTQKVLRVANSAGYAQFGGVSTVSRAVMLLGFSTIKALSLSLVMIEHLRNKDQAVDLRDEVVRAFFASLIARKLAERCRYRDIEEARIAAMFHLMGRMLAHFYFPAEAALVSADVARGEAEPNAAIRHLGTSYEELGMAVARSWHLPDRLITALSREDDKLTAPRNEGDWVRLFANAGRTLMTAALENSEPQRYKASLQAYRRYESVMPMTERELRVAVDEAMRECLLQAPIFGVDAQASGALASLRQLAGLPTVPASKGGAETGTAGAAVADTAAAANTAPRKPDAAPASPSGAATAPADNPFMKIAGNDRPEVIGMLATCVQEVTETLIGEFQLNQLLRMILETIYRALGAQRVMLATRSTQRQAVVGRFGFGDGLEGFVHGFALPLDDSSDVLRLSLVRNADLLVEDISQRAIRDLIPAWFSALHPGKSVLMLPLLVDKSIAGLIYADHATPGGLTIGPKELSLLKTLRNQAVLAVRQKSTSR